MQNRREFLKAFSIYTGSSVILSAIPWFEPLRAIEREEGEGGPSVKLGIIGSGSRGQYLMEFLKRIPGVELLAVCDDYPPNLQKGLEITAGKAKTFSDYRSLLDMAALDAVVIATPLHLHAALTRDALLAGKHVFCEKSMAKTTDECLDMLNTHYQTGKILQIGHQRMFDLRFLRGIDTIRSGKIGSVTQIKAFWHRNNNWRREVPTPSLEKKINWRLYKDFSCGLMTELASHHLQVANWVMGAYPLEAIGTGSINYWKDGREVFDNVNCIYSYPGGVKMIYDSLISNKKYGMEVQVMGPLGTLEMETGKLFSENPPPAPGILQLINQIEHKIFEAVPIGGPSWIPESANADYPSYLVEHLPQTDGSDLQLEVFVQTVRDGKPIKGMAEQGFFAGVATLIGHQAMETGNCVKWPDNCKIAYSDRPVS